MSESSNPPTRVVRSGSNRCNRHVLPVATLKGADKSVDKEWTKKKSFWKAETNKQNRSLRVITAKKLNIASSTSVEPCSPSSLKYISGSPKQRPYHCEDFKGFAIFWVAILSKEQRIQNDKDSAFLIPHGIQTSSARLLPEPQICDCAESDSQVQSVKHG